MSSQRVKLKVSALDPIAIGKRVRSARRSRGWKQRHLAEAIGVRPLAISNWETGTRTPRSDMLVALATVLKRRIWWLLVGSRAQPWRTSGESK